MDWLYLVSSSRQWATGVGTTRTATERIRKSPRKDRVIPNWTSCSWRRCDCSRAAFVVAKSRHSNSSAVGSGDSHAVLHQRLQQPRCLVGKDRIRQSSALEYQREQPIEETSPRAVLVESMSVYPRIIERQPDVDLQAFGARDPTS
jgi:hypothetical protein